MSITMIVSPFSIHQCPSSYSFSTDDGEFAFEYVSENPTRPFILKSSYVARMARVLKRTATILEDNHIDYWCTGDLLLGAACHQGFVPWSDRMELGMLFDYIEPLVACENAFQQQGLFFRMNPSGCEVFADDVGPILDIRFYTVRNTGNQQAQSFIIPAEVNCIYRLCEQEEGYPDVQFFNHNDILATSVVSFMGFSLRVPYSMPNTLVALYGPQWRFHVCNTWQYLNNRQMEAIKQTLF